ncbi:hypothetical protein F4775DRAFT_560716 [Biscogniauxia sp. FL1348]|nr:hypothetical protein F4775DRAFT_560716 [Biscogniauxia sp. FL1348]
MYRVCAFALSLALLIGSAVAQVKLNVTAISARDGNSVIECWQLDNPFASSSKPGVAGCAIAQLGHLDNLTYTIVPSNYDGGLHVAPYKQWVFFASGVAHITVPDDSTEAFVKGGDFGLIFAADTADVSRRGHKTAFPGNAETMGLQIPTRNGEIPAHSVVHAGPCEESEMVGFRELAATGL